MKKQPSPEYIHAYNEDNADNAIASITLAAAEGVFHVLDRIDAGYGAAPTTTPGLLTVSVNGTVVWRMPITAAGSAPYLFDGDAKPYTAVNQAMVIALSASGNAGDSGYVNTITH